MQRQWSAWGCRLTIFKYTSGNALPTNLKAWGGSKACRSCDLQIAIWNMTCCSGMNLKEVETKATHPTPDRDTQVAHRTGRTTDEDVTMPLCKKQGPWRHDLPRLEWKSLSGLFVTLGLSNGTPVILI